MSDASTPFCPRCGYDLSGEVGRWEDRCPVDGVCPECGLAIRWAVVLNPGRGFVPGFVEHSKGLRGTVVAAWRTWWWALWPKRFWDRVTLEAPVRARRWLAWLAILVPGSKLAAGLLYIGAAFIEYRNQFGSVKDLAVELGDTFVQVLFGGVAHVRAFPVRSGTGLLGSGWMVRARPTSATEVLLYVPLMVAIPALVLLLLPHTRKVVKVRAVHVVRALVYSLSWLGVLCLLDVLNALRVFTRTQTGMLFLDDWMPNPRSDPAWPRAITDRTVPIVTVVLCILVAWLTVWWWCAIRSWRLERERGVMISLAIIWVLSLAIVFVHFVNGWILHQGFPW